MRALCAASTALSLILTSCAGGDIVVGKRPICETRTAVAVVAVADDHTCAATTEGIVWCWGENEGQLGDGTSHSSSVPVRPEGIDAVVALAAGDDQTCAVRTDGSLWCWGENGQGQLGVGDRTRRLVPTRVGTLTGWTAVAMRYDTTCALRADGTLWCWGLNTHGQLGLGDTGDGTERLVPTQVGTATNWAALTVGAKHGCAIRADASMACWGLDNYGQLGLEDTTDRNVPTSLEEPPASWAQVAGGETHTCGVASEGSLWCWGRNSNAQLGLGDQDDRHEPAQVGQSTSWAMAAAGETHSCALDIAGSLFCWGNASELGLADETRRDVPTAITPGVVWQSIVTGLTHTCAIRSDGSLWCWGRNNDGELGLGDTADRLIPTETCVPAGT